MPDFKPGDLVYPKGLATPVFIGAMTGNLAACLLVRNAARHDFLIPVEALSSKVNEASFDDFAVGSVVSPKAGGTTVFEFDRAVVIKSEDETVTCLYTHDKMLTKVQVPKCTLQPWKAPSAKVHWA